jgi:hypothetical protein
MAAPTIAWLKRVLLAAACLFGAPQRHRESRGRWHGRYPRDPIWLRVAATVSVIQGRLGCRHIASTTR